MLTATAPTALMPACDADAGDTLIAIIEACFADDKPVLFLAQYRSYFATVEDINYDIGKALLRVDDDILMCNQWHWVPFGSIAPFSLEMLWLVNGVRVGV